MRGKRQNKICIENIFKFEIILNRINDKVKLIRNVSFDFQYFFFLFIIFLLLNMIEIEMNKQTRKVLVGGFLSWLILFMATKEKNRSSICIKRPPENVSNLIYVSAGGFGYRELPYLVKLIFRCRENGYILKGYLVYGLPQYFCCGNI